MYSYDKGEIIYTLQHRVLLLQQVAYMLYDKTVHCMVLKCCEVCYLLNVAKHTNVGYHGIVIPVQNRQECFHILYTIGLQFILSLRPVIVDMLNVEFPFSDQGHNSMSYWFVSP